MLIVLDSDSDTAQTTPLQPGGSSCTVLVTSRHQLTGLVTGHGAHPITLDVLDREEAHQVLTRHLGAHRVEVEPGAVAELLARAAGRPRARGGGAARAAGRPGRPRGGRAGGRGRGGARGGARDAGEAAADL